MRCYSFAATDIREATEFQRICSIFFNERNGEFDDLQKNKKNGFANIICYECRCFHYFFCFLYKKPFQVIAMDDRLILKNRLKEVRTAKSLSQAQLAELVGVSRNTISSIETGQYSPTAKLALVLCIALDVKFETLFYF